jgi:hypothetical protein
VCDQETSKNEEAKARYRAVANTTTMGCNVKKTNKQTNKHLVMMTMMEAGSASAVNIFLR